MKIGSMRHRIEIQIYSNSENEVGENIKSWVKYKTLWSEKTQLRGSNTYEGDKEGIEYTYRFKIRYRNDLNENMRIVHNGIIYDIKHINAINELRLYETHIDCIQHKEGVYNE
ncbi:MAG: phage head closure protein [Peptostreptococcaceae bacterium]|nr:phage head closure protein [Peptostreptococcaceae bacterium]